MKILCTKSASCNDSDETSWYDLLPVCVRVMSSREERNRYRNGWEEMLDTTVYLNRSTSLFEAATLVFSYSNFWALTILLFRLIVKYVLYANAFIIFKIFVFKGRN